VIKQAARAIAAGAGSSARLKIEFDFFWLWGSIPVRLDVLCDRNSLMFSMTTPGLAGIQEDHRNDDRKFASVRVAHEALQADPIDRASA
jgi:hypothetical protein